MLSQSVALSGSFVPFAKSKSAKLDVMVDARLVTVEVVDDVTDVVSLSTRVVVDDVAVVVEVEPSDRIVAAPAATTHNMESPAPTMEPVSLIFMICNPRY